MKIIGIDNKMFYKKTRIATKKEITCYIINLFLKIKSYSSCLNHNYDDKTLYTMLKLSFRGHFNLRLDITQDEFLNIAHKQNITSKDILLDCADTIIYSF